MISVEEYKKLRGQKISDEDVKELQEGFSAVTKTSILFWTTQRDKYGVRENCKYKNIFSKIALYNRPMGAARIELYKLLSEKLGVMDQCSAILEEHENELEVGEIELRNLLLKTIKMLETSKIDMISVEEYAELRKQTITEEDIQQLMMGLSEGAQKRVRSLLLYGEALYGRMLNRAYYGIRNLGNEGCINVYLLLLEKLGVLDQAFTIIEACGGTEQKVGCENKLRNLLRETVEYLNAQYEQKYNDSAWSY